jgi:hypothetical protein
LGPASPRVEEQGKQRAARDDKSERRGMTTAMLGHTRTVTLLSTNGNRIFCCASVCVRMREKEN